MKGGGGALGFRNKLVERRTSDIFESRGITRRQASGGKVHRPAWLVACGVPKGKYSRGVGLLISKFHRPETLRDASRP